MLNRVTLIGRLGKDPEVRRLESGAAVAKFTLATSESYKDKDGNKVDTTEWHNVVVWRSLAEIAEKFLKKGMLIYVEGKLTYREYTDKDGNKRRITEIIARDMVMLDSRGGGEQRGEGFGGGDRSIRPEAGPPEASEPMADDDIPF